MLRILSVIATIWAMVHIVAWRQKTLSAKHFTWMLLMTLGVNAMKMLASILLALLLLASPACAEMTTDSKPATTYTAEINSAIYSLLDFSDASEYDNAVPMMGDAEKIACCVRA